MYKAFTRNIIGHFQRHDGQSRWRRVWTLEENKEVAESVIRQSRKRDPPPASCQVGDSVRECFFNWSPSSTKCGPKCGIHFQISINNPKHKEKKEGKVDFSFMFPSKKKKKSIEIVLNLLPFTFWWNRRKHPKGKNVSRTSTADGTVPKKLRGTINSRLFWNNFETWFRLLSFLKNQYAALSSAI